MIKQIEYPELEQCLEVIRNSFSTVAEEFNLTEQNAATNGAFMKIQRLQNDYDKGGMMYGYEQNGKIVGFAQLVPKNDGIFELEKLAVLPAYRHNGYGRQLIEFIADKAKACEARKITIGIIEENKRLKDWYLQNGFVHTGTKKFDHLPFTVGFMEMQL